MTIREFLDVTKSSLEVIIAWREQNVNCNLALTFSGCSRLDNGDYGIHFHNDNHDYYESLILLSQIDRIFTSKVTDDLVIVLKDL